MDGKENGISNAGTWIDGLATDRVAVAMVEELWKQKKKKKKQNEAVERWEIEKDVYIFCLQVTEGCWVEWLWMKDEG